MAEQTESKTDARSTRLNGHSLIGVGKHATVWLSANGAEARKRYLGNDTYDAADYAEREYAALLRAGSALADIPEVRSPKPYRIDPDRGELVMEYCDAVPLHRALANESFEDRRAITNLAIAIGSGIAALTDELDLEDVDFSVRNTLVSSDLTQVVLIDFTTRPQSLPYDYGSTKLENALGSFLSSVITYQLHRTSLLDMTTSRRLRTLARDVITGVSVANPIDIDNVREIAWQFFWRQSINRGWKRYLWFNTIGAMLFRTLLYGITRDQPSLNGRYPG